jgi:hypothetical protein
VRVPALVHAKAGNDCGGVFVEKQLEMVWRVVRIHSSDSDEVIAPRTQLVDRLRESARRCRLPLSEPIASGIGAHPISRASHERLSTCLERLAVAVEHADKVVADHTSDSTVRRSNRCGRSAWRTAVADGLSGNDGWWPGPVYNGRISGSAGDGQAEQVGENAKVTACGDGFVEDPRPSP